MSFFSGCGAAHSDRKRAFVRQKQVVAREGLTFFQEDMIHASFDTASIFDYVLVH